MDGKKILVDILGTLVPNTILARMNIDFRENAEAVVTKAKSTCFVPDDHEGEDIVLAYCNAERTYNSSISPERLGFPKNIEKMIGILEGNPLNQDYGDFAGRIALEGYRNGTLKTSVYSDVGKAFRRILKTGREIYCFTEDRIIPATLGGVSHFFEPLIFKTSGENIGGGRAPTDESESYIRIARVLEIDAASMTFISATPQKVKAAADAGYGKTYLVNRSGRESLYQGYKTGCVVESLTEVPL